MDKERQGGGACDSVVPFVASHVMLPLCQDSKKAKIVQSVRSLAALFQLPSGSRLLLRMEVPTWLQTISGGTALHCERAVKATQLPIPIELQSKVRGRQRAVCTDGDAAVEKAEHRMAAAEKGSVCLAHDRPDLAPSYEVEALSAAAEWWPLHAQLSRRASQPTGRAAQLPS